VTPSFPVNTQSRRWMSTVMACFHPFFEPGQFSYQVFSPNRLLLYCAKWGDIGQLVFEENQPERTALQLMAPSPISPDEALRYYKLLSGEVLRGAGAIAYSLGKDDVVARICAEALYEKRLTRHREFTAWLYARLRIFGYLTFYNFYTLNESKMLDEPFDFPLQGTPALFGVMIQAFVQTLRRQPDFKQLGIQLVLPGGRKEVGSLPSDANPVEIHLKHGKNQCSLQASTVPSGGSRLHVYLKGSLALWNLWDQLRDEMERLGWYEFPKVPEIQERPSVSQLVTEKQAQPKPSVETLAQQESVCETQAQPEPPVEVQTQAQPLQVKVLMLVPDKNGDREMVRLFLKGKPHDEIGSIMGLAARTVQNKVGYYRRMIRDENGNELIPSRNRGLSEWHVNQKKEKVEGKPG